MAMRAGPSERVAGLAFLIFTLIQVCIRGLGGGLVAALTRIL
jgi:hypothetical protein